MSDLIRQYAIRKPDGELWTPPRDSLFGGLFGDTPQQQPKIFNDFDSALRTLQRLQSEAMERLGIVWMGTIEQRLCTPFSVTDPAEHLVDEIQRWIGEL